MTRNELLKLANGRYLVSDDIGNYKYILIIDKEDKDHGLFIGNLFNYVTYNGTYFSPNISIWYENDEIEVDWSYNNLPIKVLRASMTMGGLRQTYDFRRDLHKLRLVGKYDKDTMAADMRKFKTNLWSNTSRYDKKWSRNYKLNKNN